MRLPQQMDLLNRYLLRLRQQEKYEAAHDEDESRKQQENPVFEVAESRQEALGYESRENHINTHNHALPSRPRLQWEKLARHQPPEWAPRPPSRARNSRRIQRSTRPKPEALKNNRRVEKDRVHSSQLLEGRYPKRPNHQLRPILPLEKVPEGMLNRLSCIARIYKNLSSFLKSPLLDETVGSFRKEKSPDEHESGRDCSHSERKPPPPRMNLLDSIVHKYSEACCELEELVDGSTDLCWRHFREV
ncbi:glycine-rich protein [Striga asiatica]|uniref:Glycine-rich protein n=1 Tax=Striga asiatica TaxID=4170 RepID=A0A5A7R508_STRAF|nr:glycine-rich protein [Striga asiatica]